MNLYEAIEANHQPRELEHKFIINTVTALRERPLPRVENGLLNISMIDTAALLAYGGLDILSRDSRLLFNTILTEAWGNVMRLSSPGKTTTILVVCARTPNVNL